MKKYSVKGMSCAACVSRVEKAVSSLSGVESCSVNLLTGSMVIEGNISDKEIINAVEKAGYAALVYGEEEKSSTGETVILRRRFFSSLIFLLMLMYISMGHMFSLPLPGFISENPLLTGVIQLILTTVILFINKKFFVSGVRGVLNKAPNMDTLVSMGSGVAFLYSIYNLFEIKILVSAGNISGANHILHNLYFESSAMIVTLITVGKMLEAYSKGKTTNALKSLMNLVPETASVIRDGKEIVLPLKEVICGDIFVVRPGSKIPADGVVLEGSGAVDASALTGESIPQDKAEGDSVSAGTLNLSGFLKCRATKVSGDTTLSQIIKMVSDAASTKAPVAKAADKVSGIFVPSVLVISAVTLIVWLFIGRGAEEALTKAIAVLVISCPCALGLATPVAIMVGSGVGAKSGILFKTAQSLEITGKVNTVVFDKTGTLTKGEPEVTDVVPFSDFDEIKLLETAYSLETKSEHPLAKAIVKYCENKEIKNFDTTDFEYFPGNGLFAKSVNVEISGGNLNFIKNYTVVNENEIKTAEKLAEEGKTPVFFCSGGKLCGIIAVADALKEDSREAVELLKRMDIKTVMLTGDNHKTAKAIGETVGVDEVISGVLPGGKDEVIKNLKRNGKVLMVGDGINDALALTRADIGVAIGAGEDIAIDAAEVVLMRSNPVDVVWAIKLSRATLKNIYENLFWAFIYNLFGIPLAAGVFGLTLNPMFAAGAMSLSSFCVVSNALRLNLADIKNPEKYNKKMKIKEYKEMKVTLKIDGMMCPHCEARVKQTLEAIDGVKEAVPSHEKGEAEIILLKEVPEKMLKEAVEGQGYKVL